MYIPTNSDMCIRYDDVLEAIEEFESAQESDDPDEEIALPYSAQEYLALKKFADDAGTFDEAIREDDFVRHIRDLIDECYEMPKETQSGQWPYRHITIDYAAAADEARQDYYEVDFDGVTYLCR